MNTNKSSAEWLKSAEAKKELRISSCDLMHYRTGGKLRSQKQGNEFVYSRVDVETLKAKPKPAN